MPLDKINEKLKGLLPPPPKDFEYYTTIGDSEDGVLCLKISLGRSNAYDSHNVSLSFWDVMYLTVGISYEMLPIIMAVDDEDFDNFTYSPVDTVTGEPLLMMDATQAREKSEESLKNVHDAFDRFIRIYNIIS